MNWFAFEANNSPTFYGFGTKEEADRYADVLNDGKTINLYAARVVKASEVGPQRLDQRDDVVNLNSELEGEL